MPMALKRDVTLAQQHTPHAKPVDLVHLSNQTMGDAGLEREILTMFRSQSAIYLKMMTDCSDVTNRIRAAHSLKGAARGVGAFRLAELAEEVERVRHAGYGNVKEELGRVNAYIDTLIGQH